MSIALLLPSTARLRSKFKEGAEGILKSTALVPFRSFVELRAEFGTGASPRVLALRKKSKYHPRGVGGYFQIASIKLAAT